MKIHVIQDAFGKIEYWYDSHTRCWFAMRVDANGNQVGDTIDAYRKDSILDCISRGFLNPVVS